MDENAYVLVHPKEKEAHVRNTGDLRATLKLMQDTLPGNYLEIPVRRGVELTCWEAGVSQREEGSRPQMFRGRKLCPCTIFGGVGALV